MSFESFFGRGEPRRFRFLLVLVGCALLKSAAL
jgi:hypothetical protein